MLKWDIYEFNGIVPRLKGRLLPHGYATVAHDVDLTHGTLKPFREPKKVSDKTSDARLHVSGCDILTFDKCVDVANWLPDCPRLFITGRVGYPETVEYSGNSKVYRRLGVPSPAKPPEVKPINKTGDKARSVAYLTTFVNHFGEESAPSLPSAHISIEDADSVELFLNYNPPLEYDVKSIRIYRRETGFRLGSEKEQSMATEWFLIKEVPIDTGLIIDDVPLLDVGQGLVTMEVRPPPSDMKNITALEGTAMLAGSVRNRVLFSENMQPHNFPLAQEMTLDDNIVAMQSVNESLYIATDGHPYRILAEDGCDKRACRQTLRYNTPHPMIACHTGRGSVATPFGMIYVGTDGLVLLSNNDNPIVITSEFFSYDDWRLLQPHTFRLEYHKGAVFAVSEEISFILWIDPTTYRDADNKKLVTISDEPIDMFETRQGELLLMNETGIYQWNSAETLRPYKWVSEEVDSGFTFPVTRIRARVEDGSSDITVEHEWGEQTRTFIAGNEIIPYTRQGRHRRYFLRVEGTGTVSEIETGVSQIDMSRGG